MLIGIDVNALTLKEPTGVERYVHELLASMMRAPVPEGVHVRLYAASIPEKYRDLPAGWEWRIVRSPLGKAWTHLGLSMELWRNPPDVYFHPAHEIPFSLPKKIRVVSTVHDLAFRHAAEAYTTIERSRQEWAIHRIAKRAQTIIAVSQTTADDLRRFFRVVDDRLRVIPHGVDRERFSISPAGRDAILTRHRLTAGQYFFFLGRLEEKKNLVTLIRGFTALKTRLGVGHPLALVLAGKWGRQSDAVRREVKQNGRDVVLLGFVSDNDLPALYAGARAVCVPSRYEGFGLPVLEAFAAGTPVLTSDTPALREVGGDATMVLPMNDVSLWSKGLEQMLFDHAKRDSMIAAGRERVSQFSWAATAEKTWEVLRT